jgi:hypothetical protein
VQRYVLAVIRHIELNPVRALMVAEPWKFARASLHSLLGLRDERRLTTHPAILAPWGDSETREGQSKLASGDAPAKRTAGTRVLQGANHRLLKRWLSVRSSAAPALTTQPDLGRHSHRASSRDALRRNDGGADGADHNARSSTTDARSQSGPFHGPD